MTDFNEQYVPGIASAKRLDIQWTPWLGDWFVSYSPRNGNSNAEGPWDQWVSLALSILQHPMTEIVRPDVHAAVADVENRETERALTDAELRSFIPVEDY